MTQQPPRPATGHAVLRLEKVEDAVLGIEGKLAAMAGVLERLDAKVRNAGL